VLCVGRNIRPI